MIPAPVTEFSFTRDGRLGDEVIIRCRPTSGFVEALFLARDGAVVVVPMTNRKPSRFSTFRALALTRAGRTAYQPRTR